MLSDRKVTFTRRPKAEGRPIRDPNHSAVTHDFVLLPEAAYCAMAFGFAFSSLAHSALRPTFPAITSSFSFARRLGEGRKTIVPSCVEGEKVLFIEASKKRRRRRSFPSPQVVIWDLLTVQIRPLAEADIGDNRRRADLKQLSEVPWPHKATHARIDGS